METREFWASLNSQGFESIWVESFQGHECMEEQFFAWHDEKGILVIYDTYGRDKVNSATMYYCVKPNNWPPEDFWQVTESGGFLNVDGSIPNSMDDELVWLGSHDARNGVRHIIQRLEKYGTFLSQWVGKQNVWCCHYGDTNYGEWRFGKLTNKTFDYYKMVNEEKLSMLPKDVQTAIHVR